MAISEAGLRTRPVRRYGVGRGWGEHAWQGWEHGYKKMVLIGSKEHAGKMHCLVDVGQDCIARVLGRGGGSGL